MPDAYSFEDYRQSTQRALQQVACQQVRDACDVLEAVWRAGHAVWACGNGGSAATASHFCEDLAKLMYHEASRGRLRVATLTESAPFITALANDDGYERIFELQLAMLASPGDALVCLSGSGNSPNVVRAARWANAHGLRTLGLTGYDGGQLAHLVGVQLHVPSHNMGLLEGVHMMVLDYISKELRHRAYGIPHVNR